MSSAIPAPRPSGASYRISRVLYRVDTGTRKPGHEFTNEVTHGLKVSGSCRNTGGRVIRGPWQRPRRPCARSQMRDGSADTTQTYKPLSGKVMLGRRLKWKLCANIYTSLTGPSRICRDVWATCSNRTFGARLHAPPPPQRHQQFDLLKD